MARHRHRLNIHQKRPALARQFYERGLARGGADQRRVGFGVRARPQHRDMQVPIPAMVLEGPLGPGGHKDVLCLLQPRLGLVVVDAKTLIVVNVVGRAAAEADNQTALGDVVEDRQLLGQADRMVQCGLHDGKAELGAPGSSRQCTCEYDRVDIGADPVEMMLGQPNHVDAQLVGEQRLAQGLVDHGAVALEIAAVGKQEITEEHCEINPLDALRRKTAHDRPKGYHRF